MPCVRLKTRSTSLPSQEHRQHGSILRSIYIYIYRPQGTSYQGCHKTLLYRLVVHKTNSFQIIQQSSGSAWGCLWHVRTNPTNNMHGLRWWHITWFGPIKCSITVVLFLRLFLNWSDTFRVFGMMVNSVRHGFKPHIWRTGTVCVCHLFEEYELTLDEVGL